MEQIIWTTEKRRAEELSPAPYNPRKWSDKDTAELTKSLERFNLADPIVINQNNTIIGGHFRLHILKQKGLSEVDVRVPSRLLTEHEEKELNLRLNKNLGQFDFDLLANFDEDMLKDVGFASEELDKIFQLNEKPEDDEIPAERAETGIVLGDLYQLGEHRLLCGDSTKKADVERLMGGLKVDMILTDPPYGINLDTDYTAIMNRGKEYSKVIGDEVEWDFNRANWFDCAEQFWFGAENYRYTLPRGGSWFVWNKQISEHDGASHTGSLFELLWSKAKHKREIVNAPYFRFYGMDTKERLHPTQKPVILLEWFIKKFSSKDNLIIDLFGGSGSTLIACEKLNRKCRMMEIDPIYCQVIIDRWEKFTGKKAEKINGAG